MIPRAPEDFSVEWMSGALEADLRRSGRKILQVRGRYHDAPGQTADTVILDLEYDGHAPFPNRMFGKITARNTEIQEFAKSFDLYRREVTFYKSFSDAGIPVPHCYYGEFDPSTYEFVLLLEDLSSGACPSWGITEEQAVMAIAQLPSFHSKWWNHDAAKRFDWAIQFDESEFWDQLRVNLSTNFRKAQERVGDDLPKEFSEIVDSALNKYDALLSYLATRPFTLVHGDYWFKQFFFPRVNGSGRFAVFDWQFPFVAPGAWDLARVMSLALPTSGRRRLQDGLLSDYLGKLQMAGVANYSGTDLRQDLATGCLMNLLIHANALGGTDLSLLDKEAGAYGMRWQEVLIDRVVDAALDFGTPELLRRL